MKIDHIWKCFHLIFLHIIGYRPNSISRTPHDTRPAKLFLSRDHFGKCFHLIFLYIIGYTCNRAYYFMDTPRHPFRPKFWIDAYASASACVFLPLLYLSVRTRCTGLDIFIFVRVLVYLFLPVFLASSILLLHSMALYFYMFLPFLVSICLSVSISVSISVSLYLCLCHSFSATSFVSLSFWTPLLLPHFPTLFWPRLWHTHPSSSRRKLMT